MTSHADDLHGLLVHGAPRAPRAAALAGERRERLRCDEPPPLRMVPRRDPTRKRRCDGMVKQVAQRAPARAARLGELAPNDGPRAKVSAQRALGRGAHHARHHCVGGTCGAHEDDLPPRVPRLTEPERDHAQQCGAHPPTARRGAPPPRQRVRAQPAARVARGTLDQCRVEAPGGGVGHPAPKRHARGEERGTAEERSVRVQLAHARAPPPEPANAAAPPVA